MAMRHLGSRAFAGDGNGVDDGSLLPVIASGGRLPEVIVGSFNVNVGGFRSISTYRTRYAACLIRSSYGTGPHVSLI